MSTSTHPPALLQEEDRVAGGKILAGALVVLVVSAVMVGWAVATTDAYLPSLRPTMDFPEERLGPREAVAGVNEALLGDQPGLGEILNARQQSALGSYRWIDRERGIVTLPIEQAMDRVAQGMRP